MTPLPDEALPRDLLVNDEFQRQQLMARYRMLMYDIPLLRFLVKHPQELYGALDKSSKDTARVFRLYTAVEVFTRMKSRNESWQLVASMALKEAADALDVEKIRLVQVLNASADPTVGI